MLAESQKLKQIILIMLIILETPSGLVPTL